MHSLIPLDTITIPDYRQRAVISDLSVVELAHDIEANDLLHPISIRHTNPPTLVTGGRRLAAIQQLNRQSRTFSYAGQPVPLGFVPVVRISDREELSYLEAEYSENVQRLDLTWQENALARARLHDLRLAQTDGAQTPADTAAEIYNTPEPSGSARIAVRDDLILAEHFDDPDIVKAKTKKDAMKILEMKALSRLNQAKAEAMDLEDSPHNIYHGDVVSTLAFIESGSFDILLTDPPYGIGADEFGDQTFIDHSYDDSFETWGHLMTDLARESYRVCKESAHAYIFCDINNWKHLSEIFSAHGWKVWTRPLIWYKGNLGTLPRPNHGPRYTYEAILFASKGDKPITQIGAHDVISIPTTTKPRHAAEKPVDLYVNLLRRSAEIGDKILDPFAGSGTIFPAANVTSCFATGIELDESSYNLAKSRMEDKE